MMYNRILIVRLSALGDVALTLPLLFALRDRLPAARMGWVVDEPFVPILKDLSQLDRIHIWRKSGRTFLNFWHLIREVRAENYQVSIDPQGLTRSAVISFLSGIPVRVGFRHAPLEGRELAPLLTNRQVTVPGERRHVSSRNLYLGSALGLNMPKQMPVKFPEDPETDKKIQRWWKSKDLPQRTMIFGIGAGWPTKIWPVKAMTSLIDEALDRGYKCVILWGPQERDRLTMWQTELGEKVLWTPETDVHEMVAILKLSKRYAGPDSAALHLASLLGKPTFSWYGPTDPKRCAPRGKAHAFVAKGPHSWHRKRDSRQGLQTLTGKEVIPAFRNWLENEG